MTINHQLANLSFHFDRVYEQRANRKNDRKQNCHHLPQRQIPSWSKSPAVSEIHGQIHKVLAAEPFRLAWGYHCGCGQTTKQLVVELLQEIPSLLVETRVSCTLFHHPFQWEWLQSTAGQTYFAWKPSPSSKSNMLFWVNLAAVVRRHELAYLLKAHGIPVQPVCSSKLTSCCQTLKYKC